MYHELWRMPSFYLQPIITFVQTVYSVELIQCECVLVDDEPSLTQLLSCHPAEGTKRSSCLSIA